MARRITGPAIVLDGRDAAAVHAQLCQAIRGAYLVRGLQPPRALLNLADELGVLAHQFRENRQVNGLIETVPAKPAPILTRSEVLNVEQASVIMSVSEQYVRELARQGVVTATRQGERGTWQIDAGSAMAWAADRQTRIHDHRMAG